MPYKDAEVAKQKASERKKRWQKRERAKRISAGLPEDGRGKHGHHISGSKHRKWNNALISSDGYRLIRVGLSHPLADQNGYAPEHAVVVMAANSPGACLLRVHPDIYLIHHDNEDKLDNRIENLKVITRDEHNIIHNIKKERDKEGKFTASRLLDGRTHDELPWVKNANRPA